MNKVTLLLLFVVACSGLQAQTLARHTAPGSRYETAAPVSPLYRQTYAAPVNITKFSIPGEKKKRIGSTMTVLGGALIVGGIVTYASGDPNYERTTYNQTTGNYETQTIDPKRVLGVLMIVAGTGVAVPGLIVWSKGARQYNQYMKEQGGQSLNLGINAHGTGLSYRF